MKVLVLLITAFGFMALSGCSTGNPAGTPPTANMPFATAKSAAVARDSTIPSVSLLRSRAAGNNGFAVKMYAKISAPGQNLFYSPYSISAALGMTVAGAMGETESQMRTVLEAGADPTVFHAGMNGLDLSLMGHAKTTGDLTLRVVNSSWAQSGWDFKVAYLDLLSRYYGAGVNLLDFMAQPEESRVVINTWVADQTNQKIRDLIPQGLITVDTRLVLTNAIYFLANWRYQFDPALTRERPFRLADGSVVTAKLMQLGTADEKISLLYARDQGAAVRAIDLPYKGGRISMTILLPDSGAFASYESNLSVESINSLVSKLDSVELPPVRIPKFTFASASVSLKNALKSLGMSDAFDEAKADFSGIDGRKDLVITDVIHKAYIAVDEQGTEAAAATAVIIGATGIQLDPPEFIADRPFIFLIRDRVSGAILFMGKVEDPTRS